jgi:hypothetical protein
MQMGDMQGGMGGSMMWEPTGDEDGEGEFDQFSLGDVSPALLQYMREGR